MEKEKLTYKFIKGEIHVEDLIDLIVEQSNEIKEYEQYFEENSIEAIEKKFEPYYEALAKLYDE